MKTKLLITGLAIMAMSTLVNAQNTTKGQRLLNGTGKGPAYVDNNNNGICDNYENGSPVLTRGRRNVNGVNRQAPGQGQRSGNRMGRGQGQGKNRNFIDADKNGICDYREIPAK